MKLYIDSRKNTTLIIRVNEKESTIYHNSPRDQDILSAISAVLEKENVKMDELTQIEVEAENGSFTSLRVGVSVAQALSFGLQIPINGKPPGTSIEIKYGAEPNITINSKI